MLKRERNMHTFIHYYFWAIITFTVLSAILCNVYVHLIYRSMAESYPEQHKQFYHYRWDLLSPFKFHRRFTDAVKSLADTRLNTLLSSYIFWLKCTLSVFITMPAGWIVYLFATL